MKFLIDMPLSPTLAAWLKEQGHDAVHASNIGLHRAPDAEIMKRAQSEQRIVITADLDYPRLLAMTQATGPGLILFRGGDYSEQESLERLKQTFETIPDTLLPDSIIVIEKKRIRRRSLPLENTPGEEGSV
ncbi:MAG: DUF5615 family PIN-like protein [Candidatus Manganitrophaceae bacterium]